MPDSAKVKPPVVRIGGFLWHWRKQAWGHSMLRFCAILDRACKEEHAFSRAAKRPHMRGKMAFDGWFSEV